jgi:hypothetical protein
VELLKNCRLVHHRRFASWITITAFLFQFQFQQRSDDREESWASRDVCHRQSDNLGDSWSSLRLLWSCTLTENKRETNHSQSQSRLTVVTY